ncbi:MAG: S8 family serine peptidase [Chitinophagaceae bacterium]|nr:S8 family serine peptidase [Chitinophagaceae bacterium]
MFKKALLIFSTQVICGITLAQNLKPKLKGWHLLNYQQDGYKGTGVKQAYQLLKNKKSTPVIIAVIDSGIDTAHEDLRPVLWINPKEIAGNGKDDDGNGYADDVYGWNFCGAPNGENLATNTHEITRVYHKWKPKFDGKTESNISTNSLFLFQQWKKSEAILNKQYEEYTTNFANINQVDSLFKATNKLLTTHLNKTEFVKRDIAFITAQDSVGMAVSVWNNIFDRAGDTTVKNTAVIADIEGYKNILLNNKKRKEELPQDFRGEMVKDEYENIKDSIYGNNNLTTGSGNHGTHVSGIIGAKRNNNIGVDGIVDNVRIMAIRAVPGGDEHDKDVALAIRYAVNNGAKIINMSFGKPVSPYKKMVDDAIKYAAAKGVLIVHGSGNDGENTDENSFYPNPKFLDGTSATNMLTIGASGDYSTGSLTASFSNYGAKTVDIFAPGVYINSTITNNGYDAYDGTSMASPVAAGVAGLLKSYFPKLTPKQLIDLILQSGTEVKEEVILPGTNKNTKMKMLCKSGKIINAYEAVKLALKLYGK